MRAVRRVAAVAALPALLLVASGCGSSSTATPTGLVISGPGLSTSQPPWHAEYEHLAERLKLIGIPPGGQEKFHIHALLHIYDNGLLVPLSKNTGLEPAKHLESSLHTHDSTGIIHMEAPYPYGFTLGDFFAVWGVKLGPAQVGGLTGLGGDKLHFYVNGKTLSNPAAYVMHNGDNIVIGYGKPGSFPLVPSTLVLKLLAEGKGGLGCSAAMGKHHGKGCTSEAAKPTPKSKG
jgi:hypothetical protein